jgi:hypothetical protein
MICANDKLTSLDFRFCPSNVSDHSREECQAELKRPLLEKNTKKVSHDASRGGLVFSERVSCCWSDDSVCREALCQTSAENIVAVGCSDRANHGSDIRWRPAFRSLLRLQESLIFGLGAHASDKLTCRRLNLVGCTARPEAAAHRISEDDRMPRSCLPL